MENIKIKEINAKPKEEKRGIIKKYPYNGRSKYLIDKLYILGYEPNEILKILLQNKEYKKELINFAKKTKSEESQNSNNLKMFQKSRNKIMINEMPTLLNEISNDYKKIMPDIDLITNMLFPNKIEIYVKANYNKFEMKDRNPTQETITLPKTKSTPPISEEEIETNTGRFGRESVRIKNLNSKDNDDEEEDLALLNNKQYNMIFSYNPQEGENSKKSINGFAYIFYKKCRENQIIDDVKFTFYIPMTFCIISEFPYFNSYFKLCNQIVKLFQLKNIEIPIEIILYNIINFSLSPINGDVSLNIEPISFPSNKTVVESISTQKKKKDFQIIKEEDESDTEENFGGFILYKEESQNTKENMINNDKNNINEKYNIINSPENHKNSSLFKKENTEKKKNNVKIQKMKTNLEEDNDLENSISISPDLSINKREFKSGNKILDNTRFTMGFKNTTMRINTINENKNLKKRKFKKNEIPIYEDIKFQNLSGYPLIQYNLSYVLLSNLSPQDVLIIFFYSFLEKDILFFSKNLEFLSFTINSYLNLNFPLNDEKYYFFNACVSYENFINDNSPFVGATFTTILGINSEYNSDYLKDLNKTKLKDHLAVDLDNGVLYQVDDPNDKEKNLRNKVIFDYIKKICKKEIKDDKGVILIREIKILYDKLESYTKNNTSNTPTLSSSTKKLVKMSKNSYIDYDEKGPTSIKIRNTNIQEGFYRLINYICLYFYQNLSLKSDHDKEDINKIIINRKKKGIDPESMNIIFHKDYNLEDNNYTKEEICFLDELMETMKFESFVYGFIQSYKPIDLYKIPLTLTEEFISILSRKNFVKNQNINFFTFIDNLYKKNGVEKVFIDFNPFSSEFYKKLKNYFEREVYDDNNCNCIKKEVKEKYLNILLNKKPEGSILGNLKYDEYILDNHLLIKYIRFIKNLKKEDYYHMFHLASSLEQNKIKNISIIDIENEIEKYSNNLEISSKKDICCSNIILLFILSIKSIKNYIDCQTFLSALFQNFNVFRKYYTMIMNLVYRLMKECIEKKDYLNAQDYFFCYYSCINSLRSLKLVPNENLMNIILKFDKIDLNYIIEKANKCENNEENKINEEKKISTNDEKLANYKNIKELNQTDYAFVIYNFVKNNFIKEDGIIQRVNELKGKKTLKLNIANKEGKVEKVIEPKIKFNNGEFEYQCLISTQDKILEELNRQYELYINDLDEEKLDTKILFESCLNISLFTRNTDFFQDIDDISDTFKIIFNVYLEKFCDMMKKNIKNDINEKKNESKQ